MATILSVGILLVTLILMLQVLSLGRAVKAQERQIKALAGALVDIRNYARLHVTTYAETGKRPQQVVSVVEITDGKPKIVMSTIRPLEEP
ncbi:MAG: hypothetical protein JXR77_00895 [Lentisphaeria bacterium]|nr:hypothetical protein [Lentisphaeria bacterium]